MPHIAHPSMAAPDTLDRHPHPAQCSSKVAPTPPWPCSHLPVPWLSSLGQIRPAHHPDLRFQKALHPASLSSGGCNNMATEMILAWTHGPELWPWGADPGDGWTPAQASQVFVGASLQVPRDRPSDLRHFLAQVDEEAALEQAVKFCQVHLGAAAQRQVSLTQLTPCWGPWAVGKRVVTPQIRTIPVVNGAEERWAGGS